MTWAEVAEAPSAEIMKVQNDWIPVSNKMSIHIVIKNVNNEFIGQSLAQMQSGRRPINCHNMSSLFVSSFICLS